MKKLWLIRKDQEAVSPVIATILMVAITVVLAAVLYVMVSGLLGGGAGGTRPVVTFASSVPTGGLSPNITATISIAESGEPKSAFTSFKGQILMDSNPLVAQAQTLATGTIISFGATVKVIVHDLAGEGKLTSGDTIFVYGMTSSHQWKFSLIWASHGGQIQTASWST